MSDVKCSECGCEDTKGNPVTLAPDPFMEEIYGDKGEVWECENCRDRSTDDI